jgi:uncharacterized protein (DUF427 family)
VRAVWKGTVLAESDDTVVVEGNHYFPREALRDEHFVDSDESSWCPWKGTARYLTARVGGEELPGAAWYYPRTKKRADHIRGRVAFWRGVVVEA